MEGRITKNRIDYVLVGDYYIPDLKLPEEERPIVSSGELFDAAFVGLFGSDFTG